MQSKYIGNIESSERHSVPRQAQRTSVKGASLVVSTRLEPGKSLSVELESFSRRESELSVTLLCFFLPCLKRHSQACLRLSHLLWIKTQGLGL